MRMKCPYSVSVQGYVPRKISFVRFRQIWKARQAVEDLLSAEPQSTEEDGVETRSANIKSKAMMKKKKKTTKNSNSKKCRFSTTVKVKSQILILVMRTFLLRHQHWTSLRLHPPWSKSYRRFKLKRHHLQSKTPWIPVSNSKDRKISNRQSQPVKSQNDVG
mmetsp:Transcript_8115/g.19619  ORF Transcript_8115/g.19619 Transcript_8115/m.19619 type:complete len:161 (+) Transcript_8115:242-724(+)